MSTTIKLDEVAVLGVRTIAKNREFAKEVRTKMKDLGHTSFNQYAYNGISFTSHESSFTEAMDKEDLAFLELEETDLGDDKKGYNIINYHTHTQLAKLEKRKFTRDLFNIDTLIKNPELLSKLDMIERITEASS
jgi:hypothetical protein